MSTPAPAITIATPAAPNRIREPVGLERAAGAQAATILGSGISGSLRDQHCGIAAAAAAESAAPGAGRLDGKTPRHPGFTRGVGDHICNAPYRFAPRIPKIDDKGQKMLFGMVLKPYKKWSKKGPEIVKKWFGISG